MSIINTVIKTRTFKQLTHRDRIKIELLLKEGRNSCYIAIKLDFTKRTVSHFPSLGLVEKNL